MTITIIKSGPAGLDGFDTRDWKEGDVHTLPPEHENQLIAYGVAKEGGAESKVVAPPAGDSKYADANKNSQAPQAVDTAAVAARVVADGVTHDSEGSPIPGSTNSEGGDVTHAQDLVNSETLKATDEKKDAEAEAKAEADKPKAHHAPAKHAAKLHGKK